MLAVGTFSQVTLEPRFSTVCAFVSFIYTKCDTVPKR